MPLQIVRNDITKMKVDAIVNAANSSLLGGGGVDGSIHRAAGPGLLEECRKLHGCETGNAKITKGYNLPAKYVIHTVGPIWQGGTHGEKQKLTSCYRKSLQLAEENHCASIAFPLISSGIYRYPKDQALKVATDAITDFLMHHDMDVYLVIFDKKSFQIGQKLYADIQAYIDDRYADTHVDRASESLRRRSLSEDRRAAEDKVSTLDASSVSADDSLKDALENIDESFSEMLLRKIDESGMTDAECYKKANVDRKLFSKIRANRDYKPSKNTVLAFALALKLPKDEIDEMLRTAGFALSNSNKSDIIVEYFIEHDDYNVFEINEALFAFGQNTIGNC